MKWILIKEKQRKWKINKICISQKGGAAAGRPPPPLLWTWRRMPPRIFCSFHDSILFCIFLFFIFYFVSYFIYHLYCILFYLIRYMSSYYLCFHFICFCHRQVNISLIQEEIVWTEKLGNHPSRKTRNVYIFSVFSQIRILERI